MDGDSSIDLEGPVNDVARMRQLLVGTYGMPPHRVCMLLDDGATLADHAMA